MPTRFRRRTFMKGLLTTAAAVPLTLNQLVRPVFAAGPKKALFVYAPDGCIPDRWHPTGSETSFAMNDMTEPLSRVQDRLVFIRGLDMYAGGATHEGGVAKVLTGVSDVSLDVFLGQRFRDQTPHSSVHLGAGANFENGSGSMSFIGSGQEVKPDDNPLNAFDRIFGGFEGGDEATVDLEARRRRSVLDALVGDLNGIRNRLNAGERARLDTHLDSLREVEGRIVDSPPTGACGGLSGWNSQGFSVLETDYYPKTYHKEEHFRTVIDLQSDLAAMVLGCDMSRVASIMWSHPVSPTHIAETGVTQNNHDASHYGDPSSATAEGFVTLKRWFMERFAELIDKLEAVPNADGGTLLDDTVVLLCSELGDSNAHDHRDMPFVLAGGAGGALTPGRLLDYRGTVGGENDAHTKLLVSVANAMDVAIDEYGYTGHGKGPLEGLLG